MKLGRCQRVHYFNVNSEEDLQAWSLD